jgi:hypothetical protein
MTSLAELNITAPTPFHMSHYFVNLIWLVRSLRNPKLHNISTEIYRRIMVQSY